MITIKRKNGVGAGGVSKRNINHWGTFVHEIGHAFDLKHPFDNPNYDKYSTSNFMDYSLRTDMFWRWQWLIINSNITK